MTITPHSERSNFEFGILGPLEVRFAGRRVELRRVKDRTLLAMLLLGVNQAVSVEHLLDGLWDGAERPRSLSTLRVHVSRLRQSLAAVDLGADQVIVTTGGGYALQVPGEAVDAWRFEELATTGRHQLAAGHAAAARESLRRALALWRGPVLADLPLSPALEPDMVRLEEARLSVLEDRVEADLSCGRHHELVGELEQLVGETPLRERLWGQRMIGLYRSGRQAEALRAYESLRVLLREELGIRPSPSLQQLEQAILDQDPALEQQAGSLVARLEPNPGASPHGDRRVDPHGPPAEVHNLPAQLTSFVGRQAECREVEEVLKRYRLVTLTGIGGVGKTRLALQVGAERASTEPDGAWLVELDGVSDPAMVPAAIASVLGALPSPGESSRDAVLRLLRAKQLLLVIDNCEHLLGACAELIGAILAACPQVAVLATSRERLRLDGELAWSVPPLNDVGAATQLFAERAATANPTLVLDDSAIAASTGICRRVDFLPLAIELAAGWVRLLTPEQILDRLEDRLALLTRKGSAGPARHQTLRLLLNSTYSLLTATEQALLRQVSVFCGGFSLEAAEHVADVGSEPTAVLQLLAELVDKSLVAVERRTGHPIRYRLLETVRQFAWEQLGEYERSNLESRHLDWCAELTASTAAALTGPLQATALDALQAETDNFRRALGRAVTDDPGTGLLLAVSLARYWTARGYQNEGRRWLELLLDRALDSPTELRARGRCWLGTFVWGHGDPLGAQRELRESLELWASVDDDNGRSETLAALGDGCAASGAVDEARTYYEEALASSSAANGAVKVRALNGLGTLARAHGDWITAAALFEQCLTLQGAPDDPRVRAQVLNNLAVVRLGEGDTTSAATLLSESVAIKRALRDGAGIAVTLVNLGAVAFQLGEIGPAEAHFNEALMLHEELGNDRGVAYALQGLAEVATSRGDYERAAELFGRADATRERIGVVLAPSEQEEVDRIVGQARLGGGEVHFRRSWEAGRSAGARSTVVVAPA